LRLLDTNIVVRLLGRDDEIKARACSNLFRRVEEGSEEVLLTECVLMEVVQVLTSLHLAYRLNHEDIRARLLPILTLNGLRLPDKQLYLRALDIYAAYQFLDFADALCAARMEYLGISEILSYDHNFDRVPGLKRVEP
jgi:predicted nucleic acid-binding protein